MRSTLEVLHKKKPPTPTTVFDAYWRFACERQDIYLRRLAGAGAPWTKDPILLRYKFTNAYRASDRVSQYLIRNVIYQGSGAPEEMFFRTLLFKLFNSIETWEWLHARVGPLTRDSFSVSAVAGALDKRMEEGRSVYSAAYIMPPAFKSSRRKHEGHLLLLERMLNNRLWEKLQSARAMREAFEQLLSYPSIGPFLAFQLVIDLNYSPLLNFSEMDFVCPGPGALRGIRKCFSDLGDLSPTEVIHWVAERQVEEFETRGLEFAFLGERRLQLIDCQNLFCEIDKYSRVAYPEYNAPDKVARIKQNFVARGPLNPPWYPPKWGINEQLAEGPRRI